MSINGIPMPVTDTDIYYMYEAFKKESLFVQQMRQLFTNSKSNTSKDHLIQRLLSLPVSMFCKSFCFLKTRTYIECKSLQTITHVCFLVFPKGQQ